MLVTMISKRASTAYEDEITLMRHEHVFCIPISRPILVHSSIVGGGHVIAIVIAVSTKLLTSTRRPTTTASVKAHVPSDNLITQCLL
jgi:hypothetical protein